jgi:hypothetical protein
MIRGIRLKDLLTEDVFGPLCKLSVSRVVLGVGDGGSSALGAED